MKKLIITSLLALFAGFALFSQELPLIGISDIRPDTYAFTNATIMVDANNKIENGILLMRNGLIEDVGTNVKIPEKAIVVNLNGRYIYPSFIDMYTSYGIPEVKKTKKGYPEPEKFYSNEKKAGNWNDAINSDYHAVGEFSVDPKSAKELRKLGFGTVLSFKPDGIVRGTSVLVSLVDKNENKAVIQSNVAAHYSFNKGSSEQNYPSSLQGCIALLRQTYLDAKWYTSLKNKDYTDISLEKWNAIQKYPQIFEANNKMNALRADKIGDEFGVQYIIKGGGDEYQYINEIKNTNASFIMPLVFPEKPKVENLFEAESVSLEELKHWEMAPYVYKIFEQNNIQFALTSAGLKDKKDFYKNLYKIIDLGFTEESALRSLTEVPAKLLNIDKIAGSLHKGKLANFIITSGKIFDKNTIIYENWVRGEQYVINDLDSVDYTGVYSLKLQDNEYTLKITGKPGEYKINVFKDDTIKLVSSGKIEGSVVSVNFKEDKDQITETRLSGWIEGKNFKGKAFTQQGNETEWEAVFNSFTDNDEKKEKDSLEKSVQEPGKMIYPFVAHGYIDKPKQHTYLIKNTTIWTNEQEGILENADVLVENGKIVKVGKNIDHKNAIVIDGSGKHLTSGIIDEHSHIATAGSSNEFSHSITPEVRIKDILNPDDINIYRQLSGGVTAAQILHGSANPIGGQSAIIKHRWGVNPDELLLNDGAQFLKFALGENVKQSRNPSYLNNRFPVSRMGVEAIIKDAFAQAQDYQIEWDKYNALSAKEKAKTQMPKVNLRLEAIADLFKEKSFITCHAYVQSEINMIMNLAEEFGIKAHTLIHNSEGYKIADKIKEHGAYASNLPDWWAYKFEVYQAIPYNSAMQVKQGVTVAVHSDNAELARRLNQEAAKTIKYGGLSQEEAWKLVTLNPAKILHLDHRMGSVKEGKDADLVLWTDNPLSMYARVEKTMVDGIIYYDMDEDAKIQDWIRSERNRLINKINSEK